MFGNKKRSSGGLSSPDELDRGNRDVAKVRSDITGNADLSEKNKQELLGDLDRSVAGVDPGDIDAFTSNATRIRQRFELLAGNIKKQKEKFNKLSGILTDQPGTAQSLLSNGKRSTGGESASKGGSILTGRNNR